MQESTSRCAHTHAVTTQQQPCQACVTKIRECSANSPPWWRWMRTATLACIIMPFRTSHKYGFTHLTGYPKQDRVGQNITPSMPFKWESSRKVASLAAAVAVSLLGRPKQLQWQSHTEVQVTKQFTKPYKKLCLKQ
jgi:hypothetical protein